MDALTGAARAWLREPGYVQLTARRLGGLAIAVRRHHEARIVARVDTLVAAPLHEG